MPKTSFLCKYCGNRFETFIYPISLDEDITTRCPKCDDSNLQELEPLKTVDYYEKPKTSKKKRSLQ